MPPPGPAATPERTGAGTTRASAAPSAATGTTTPHTGTTPAPPDLVAAPESAAPAPVVGPAATAPAATVLAAAAEVPAVAEETGSRAVSALWTSEDGHVHSGATVSAGVLARSTGGTGEDAGTTEPTMAVDAEQVPAGPLEQPPVPVPSAPPAPVAPSAPASGTQASSTSGSGGQAERGLPAAVLPTHASAASPPGRAVLCRSETTAAVVGGSDDPGARPD